MARRGKNIRKRKDGRWEGRYMIYDPKTGKGTSYSVYARSYTEVKEKLWVGRCAAGVADRMPIWENNGEDGITLEVAVLGWLEQIRQTRKYSTFCKYKLLCGKHLVARFGNVPLDEMDMAGAKALLEACLVHGDSASLQKSICCVLGQVLAYAKKQYHVGPGECPKPGVRAGRGPVGVLDHTEQAKLLRYLYRRMDRYRLGVLLSMSTGLRLGELCGLKWEDVDLEGKVLHVKCTVQRLFVEGKESRTALVEGEPKSEFSRREIPLSEEMIRLLGKYYGEGEYVVKGKGPMDPRTYQKRFQKYLEEAGIGKRNFHILRHTFATNCIAGGGDVKSLSEMMGHSDVKITLEKYVHPGIEIKREQMNSLSTIYGQYLGQGKEENG